MKIAVAYDNGEIGGHFGHCECFAVYDYYGEYVHECNKKLVESTDRHGHQQMAELMQELGVEAVICTHMGDEAKSLLLSMGIIPVLGYTGDADTASDMLVTGQLPHRALTAAARAAAEAAVGAAAATTMTMRTAAAAAAVAAADTESKRERCVIATLP